MSSILKRLNINASVEGIFILLVGLLWAREPVLLFADIILSRFGWIGSISIPFFIVVLIIAAFNLIMNRIGTTGIILYFVFMFVFYLTYILYPKNAIVLDSYKEQFLIAVTYIFVGMCVDFEKMKNWFYYLSVISIIIIIVQIRVFATDVLDVGFKEMMVTSYRMLPHVLMVLYFTFKERSFFRILLSIFSVISILSFGSRGPLMCIIAFIILYFMVVAPFQHKNRTRAIIVAIMISVFFFLNEILQYLRFILESTDMSTRIIDYAMGDRMFDDSGRKDIQMQLFGILNQNPLLGYGLAGDRTMTGMYAHQLLYELLFSFGYFIGSVLFILIIAVIYSGFKHTSSLAELIFLLILFCCGFISLFMSGTFITSTFFYFLLGYCLNLKKNSCRCKLKYVFKNNY